MFSRHVKLWAFGLLGVLCMASAGFTQAFSEPADRTAASGDLAKAILAGHNAERSALGLALLSWDKRLAKDASGWANKLAKERRFEHASAELSKKKQGENLWMGTADAYTYSEMLSAWLDERGIAKSGVFPDVSRTGNWVDVGHYTQIIWPSTRKAWMCDRA